MVQARHACVYDLRVLQSCCCGIHILVASHLVREKCDVVMSLFCNAPLASLQQVQRQESRFLGQLQIRFF